MSIHEMSYGSANRRGSLVYSNVRRRRPSETVSNPVERREQGNKNGPALGRPIPTSFLCCALTVSLRRTLMGFGRMSMRFARMLCGGGGVALRVVFGGGLWDFAAFS